MLESGGQGVNQVFDSRFFRGSCVSSLEGNKGLGDSAHLYIVSRRYEFSNCSGHFD